MKKINWFHLLFTIAVMECIGFLSSFLSGDIDAVYSELILPPLSPPPIVFAIVWPVLYALMGISIYLITLQRDREKKEAIQIFCIQLIMNFFWPILFFRFKLFWGTAVLIILLDITVCYMISIFNRIYKPSGSLMIPYLIWILFATYLNIAIAILN